MNTVKAEEMVWTREQIRGELFEVLRERVRDGAQLYETTRIVGDLGADSLQILEVVMQLENRFEIAIKDDSLRAVSTIRDLEELLTREVERKGCLQR